MQGMYEGEDSNSQELHIRRLRDHATYSTLQQDENIISLSMDKTFPDMRKMIVDEFCRVSQVVDKYPTLVGEKQV